MKRILRTGLLTILLAASCARPASDEHFVRTSWENGCLRDYEFSLDMADSLAYDIDLWISSNCSALSFVSFEAIGIDMLWTSPSGRPYAERVVMDRGALDNDSFYSHQLQAPYRSGITPSELGTWQLSIRLPEPDVKRYKITGTGLRLGRRQ